MGKPLISQFEKRFGDRISTVYSDGESGVMTQRNREEKLAKAITQVIAGILKREPTKDELLGLVDISDRKHRRKS